jgi:hypothetical protein
MRIRSEQIRVLADDVRRRFEEEMLVHLRGFAPRHCQVIGDNAVRQVIRLGMERAGAWGFTKRGPVRYYIELMFNLGSYFDSDPQFPWVAAVLTTPGVTDEIDRAEILFDAAAEYIRITAGEQNAYAIEALRRVRTQLRDPLPPDAEQVDALILLLRKTYPEKFEYIGEAIYRKLIPQGFEFCEECGCGGPEGRVVFVGAMFGMGHRFAIDPLLPWIQATLTDPRLADREQRVRRLRSRMQTYLDAVLAHIGK